MKRLDLFSIGSAIVLIVLLVLAAGCSNAPAAASDTQDNLSWTMPTQNTDGSALPLADIAKTTVVWGTQPGGPYTAGSQDVAAPATSVTLTRTGAGTRCYKVNVTTTAAKGSVAGLFSAEGCKTVFATPNAPTGFTVQ